MSKNSRVSHMLLHVHGRSRVDDSEWSSNHSAVVDNHLICRNGLECREGSNMDQEINIVLQQRIIEYKIVNTAFESRINFCDSTYLEA